MRMDILTIWMDGLSVGYNEWWFNVHPSHTKPILRLNIGVTNSKILEERRGALISQIKYIDSSM